MLTALHSDWPLLCGRYQLVKRAFDRRRRLHCDAGRVETVAWRASDCFAGAAGAAACRFVMLLSDAGSGIASPKIHSINQFSHAPKTSDPVSLPQNTISSFEAATPAVHQGDVLMMMRTTGFRCSWQFHCGCYGRLVEIPLCFCMCNSHGQGEKCQRQNF